MPLDLDPNLTKEEKEFVVKVLKQINISVLDPAALNTIVMAQKVASKLMLPEPTKFPVKE